VTINLSIMEKETRALKISKIAAKSAIRLFVIIVFVGALPFITGDQPWSKRLENSHFVIPNKLTLIAPALLFAGLLTLIILVIKKKYSVIDYNWLLVLNAVILLAYIIMIYIRLYSLIFV